MIDNKKFTIGHFIKGDEVYLIGGKGKPLGIVDRIGTKNIFVNIYW